MSGDYSEMADLFVSKNKRRYVIMIIVAIAAAIISIYSFSVGNSLLSMDIVLDVIDNHFHGKVPTRNEDYWGWLMDRLVFEGTIPTGIGSLLIGAILGMSGAVMQNCVRNPLADPYTTGISSAALFGVTINLVLGISIVGLPDTAGLMANAFICSMIPCALMILLSTRGKTTPTQLILIGIGVMYLFSAVTMMFKYNAEPEILNQIMEWSIGSVSKVGWTGIYCLIPTTAILFITTFYLAPQIDIISTGDNMSNSLGVDPVKTRLVCMIIISACTSVAVSFSGSIGFVGLIIPHASRLFVGAKMRLLLPCSAVMGALLLVSSEVVSKSLSVGLPVGAVTALIGAPLFLYFLVKMKTSGWGR